MLAPSPRPEFLGALSLATVFRRKFDNFDFVWLRCWDQHFSLRFPQKFKFNLQSWNFPTVTFYVWLEYASKLLRYSVASWQFSKLLYFKIIRLPAINIKRDSRKILNIQLNFPKVIVFFCFWFCFKIVRLSTISIQTSSVTVGRSWMSS